VTYEPPIDHGPSSLLELQAIEIADLKAEVERLKADRAATKPLVDAACKWCEAYDNWWRTVGDKPYDEQLSSMEIAALNCVKAACREVYEASKDKSEGEEKA
jgi:hypothetical protein